jgi:hypothetical protein
MHKLPGPNVFKESVMNTQNNDSDKSVSSKNDEGLLEKIARAIDPPSRETSDAELIDPGSNSPAPKPEQPGKSVERDPGTAVKPTDGRRQS